MRQAETPQAMRNKDGTLADFCYGFFKHIHPLITDRPIPVPLLHTNKFWVRSLPKRLPMGMIRITNSRKNESRNIHDNYSFCPFLSEESSTLAKREECKNFLLCSYGAGSPQVERHHFPPSQAFSTENCPFNGALFGRLVVGGLILCTDRQRVDAYN